MNSNTGDNNDDIEQHGGGGEITSSKKECTSCEQNYDIDTITEGINKVDILSDMSTCASCGKEGNSDDMNTCNKCKMVKYCNAACKKKHRKKHKKACERRVAELHDEQLFKEVEPKECPLCMLPTPAAAQTTFKSCCGKIICHGCIYAMHMSEGKDLCAFCRTPPPSSLEEEIKRAKNLMNKGNAEALNKIAREYSWGGMGLPQDYQKACELYLKAGELGCAAAYFNLGVSYDQGRRDMGVDKKKAKYYYELAAMMGSINARHNLGYMEFGDGNHERAMKHYIIAAKAGDEEALGSVKNGFQDGLVTKDEYANVLRAHHERQKEMKSEARDKAAASGLFGRR